MTRIDTQASTKFLKSNLPVEKRSSSPSFQDEHFFEESPSSRSRHHSPHIHTRCTNLTATYHPLATEVPTHLPTPLCTSTCIETLDEEGGKKRERGGAGEKMYLPSQFAPVGVAGWKLFSKSSLKQLCKRWPILQSRRRVECSTTPSAFSNPLQSNFVAHVVGSVARLASTLLTRWSRWKFVDGIFVFSSFRFIRVSSVPL